MKDGMSGILQQVWLGQVIKARKSSIIQAPLLSMSIFWNSEKNCQIRDHPGGVRWWKNWLRSLFKCVRIGQVRKAIKSWKSEARGPPIHSLTCFGKENLKERFLKERPCPNYSRSVVLYLVNDATPISTKSIASHSPFRTSNTIKMFAWNILIVLEMFIDCVLRFILVF
jgi:hypothetical protein